MKTELARRAAMTLLSVCAILTLLPSPARGADEPRIRLAVFRAEVTPRLGHPLLGGHYAPARSIDAMPVPDTISTPRRVSVRAASSAESEANGTKRSPARAGNRPRNSATPARQAA